MLSLLSAYKGLKRKIGLKKVIGETGLLSAYKGLKQERPKTGNSSLHHVY